MEIEKLSEWLRRLYTVFNFQASEELLREYLHWLSNWKLKDDEWETLMEMTVEECRFFPTIAELAERKHYIIERRRAVQLVTDRRKDVIQ
jgi:hypothetical protein